MNRHEFLRILAGGAVAAAAVCAQSAQMGTPETVVYKVAQGCEIKLDVYRAGEGTGRPALLWIHGGALMGGSRTQVGTPMLPSLLKLGYVIVSIDYRLAPEMKTPGIIEDVQDAYAWMRKEGARRFGIDPDRISTAGGSAGGYLTLMTGFCLKPRPRALVSYFGYGDIDGPWLAEPDDFYRRQKLVSKEDAWEGYGPVVSERTGKHGPLYLFCRQQGIWPNQVSGHDPHKEPKWFDPYCPIRNVTKAWPPTLLIHGTVDTDVPYGESKAMYARLTEAGVEHEFITVPGAGHGLVNAKPEDRQRANQRSVEWITEHTR